MSTLKSCPNFSVFFTPFFCHYRDIQQEILRGAHSHWRHSFPYINTHFLFLACFLVVLLSILLYLLRLRRIHRRAAALHRGASSSSVAWLEDGLDSSAIAVTL